MNEMIKVVAMFVTSLIPAAGFTAASVWVHYRFQAECTDHLLRAASANSPELAIPELKTAIAYLENHHLTQGNTSIFFTRPTNDLSFWFQNLKSSEKELESLPPTASALEKTNVLMKLRESLITPSKEGRSTALVPDWTAFHPHTLGWLTGLIASYLIAAGGWFWLNRKG